MTEFKIVEIEHFSGETFYRVCYKGNMFKLSKLFFPETDIKSLIFVSIILYVTTMGLFPLCVYLFWDYDKIRTFNTEQEAKDYIYGLVERHNKIVDKNIKQKKTVFLAKLLQNSIR